MPPPSLQILRLQPDARKRKNLIPLPQLRVPVNHHVRMQLAPRPQLHVLADHTIWPNLTPIAHTRLRMNDR